MRGVQQPYRISAKSICPMLRGVLLSEDLVWELVMDSRVQGHVGTLGVLCISDLDNCDVIHLMEMPVCCHCR